MPRKSHNTSAKRMQPAAADLTISYSTTARTQVSTPALHISQTPLHIWQGSRTRGGSSVLAPRHRQRAAIKYLPSPSHAIEPVSTLAAGSYTHARLPIQHHVQSKPGLRWECINHPAQHESPFHRNMQLWMQTAPAANSSTFPMQPALMSGLQTCSTLTPHTYPNHACSWLHPWGHSPLHIPTQGMCGPAEHSNMHSTRPAPECRPHSPTRDEHTAR